MIDNTFTLIPAVGADRKVWGPDHWSTLLYLESRAVDHRGILNNTHMRSNPKIHPEFAHRGSGRGNDADRYPTRLKDGATLQRHDDWSCVGDFEREGLVKVLLETGGSTPRVHVYLTDEGIGLSHRLRAHKIRGGNTGDFQE